MLNWNVLCLSDSQFIEIEMDKEQQTLPNLLSALKSPYLGWSLPVSRSRSNSSNLSSKTASPLAKKNEKDVEGFVIVEKQVPLPSQSEEEIAEYEKTFLQ